jgi:membrane-bound metal-dependent hydrolase YbcI (DUF457 family)
MPLIVGGLLANAADFDFFLAFIFHSKSWHRGFSHSIMLALVFVLALVFCFGRRNIRTAFAYGLAFTSHGILDYLTTKEGSGVELLWPFDSRRLGFGWVGLSELPSRLPAMQIVKWLLVEFAVFTPLLILMIGLRKYVWKDWSKQTTI